MMAEREALQVALDLFRSPAQVRTAQRQPLPKNVLHVIRIAAGETLDDKTGEFYFGWTETDIRAAAVFFLQQILFEKNSHAFRLLGLPPNASLTDVKDHKRALLKWLHPDRNANKWESVLLQRVVKASESVVATIGDVPSNNDPVVCRVVSHPMRSERKRHQSIRGLETKRVRKPLNWRTRLLSFAKRLSLIAAATAIAFLGVRAITKPESSDHIFIMARNMFAWIE
jgi:hypothetical protein